MISEKEFNQLMDLEKVLEDESPIILPNNGGKITRIIKSFCEKEDFILNIERGKINLSKVKYQSRYKKTNTILVRIDTNGPRHQNPDGQYINCPHIHIYKEGYGDRWAYKLDENIFSDINNLAALLNDFLKYFNVNKVPNIIYCDSLL